MNITQQCLEQMLEKAFEKANKGRSDATGSESGEIHSERSSRWVEALAEQFRGKCTNKNNIRVFSKGFCENRQAFKVNEYLYDITVIKTCEIESATGRATLEYPEQTLWHVESEFASSDSRQSIVDFGKLLMSAAENKLMILPSGRKIQSWAVTKLSKIVCPEKHGTVYFAFVPHPGRWDERCEKAVTLKKVPEAK